MHLTAIGICLTASSLWGVVVCQFLRWSLSS